MSSEMQSVTALAHLRACVLYFMDLSGECGYSISQQIQLFNNIRPLFANKPTFLAINKIDRCPISSLDPDSQSLLTSILNDGTIEALEMSCATDQGIMDARNRACEKLLAARVEQKLKGNRINDVLNKIHLAKPVARDDVPRLPFIPEQVQSRRLYDWTDPERRKLEKDLEVEAGGAGQYSIDLRKNYILDKEEWKYDVLPEFMDGKNVYDFIDPEIEAKLNALEEEEERLEAEGFYDDDEEIVRSPLSLSFRISDLMVCRWTMGRPSYLKRQIKSEKNTPFARTNPVCVRKHLTTVLSSHVQKHGNECLNWRNIYNQSD